MATRPQITGAGRAVAEQRGGDDIPLGDVVLAKGECAKLHDQEQHAAAGMGLQAAAVFGGVELLLMTSLSFFAGNGKLKPELFHGLAHERGEIGRLPGRDQIGVNNHLPVLIERASLF
jgi:hypothetical protein